jgi:plastocyanin
MAGISRTWFVAVLVSAGLLAVSSAGAENETVRITNAGFSTGTLALQQGSAVTWKNDDTIDHQVASSAAGFTSPTLTPTDTFSFTFSRPGTFVVTDPLAGAAPMTIQVAAVPVATVALKVAPEVVSYGGRVSLTGTLSSRSAGQPVSITARACHGAGFVSVGTVSSGNGGSFSQNVRPQQNTVFRVRVGSATAAAGVTVRPRLTLAKAGPGRYTLTARAPSSLVGRSATIESRQPGRSKWAVIRSVKFPSSLAVTFAASVSAGTKLRAEIGQGQAGPCLGPSLSNSVRA